MKKIDEEKLELVKNGIRRWLIIANLCILLNGIYNFFLQNPNGIGIDMVMSWLLTYTFVDLDFIFTCIKKRMNY